MSKRFSATALAIGAAFSLSVSLSPVAGAIGGPEYAATTIDPAHAASLTIHKYLNDSPAGEGTGNKLDDTSKLGDALSGVKFRVTPIKTTKPINTQEGFAEAAKLKAPVDQSLLDTAQAKTVTTEGNGEIAVTDLPVGAYYVEELPSPDAMKRSEKVGDKLSPAAPFIVFLPMTNPATTSEWNYDVHVYPKNQVTDAKKEVNDIGQNAGSDATFTITSDVPAVSREDGKPILKKLVFEDNVDAKELTIKTDGLTVTYGAEGTGNVLTSGDDYTVDANPGAGTLKVTLTQSGLDKVATARDKAPVKVQLQFKATILAAGDNGDGVIENEATVVTNNGNSTTDTTTKTNKTRTFIGKVKVTKVNDKQQKLQNADFQVFECTDQKMVKGEALTINGQNKWTTDNQGELTIDGIHVTDFANNASTEETHLCLVETKAPQGYELLTEPIALEVKAPTQDSDAATPVTMQPVKLTVTNIEKTTPNLPLTGGPGIIALVLAGVALIGGGAWFGLRGNKANA